MCAHHAWVCPHHAWVCVHLSLSSSSPSRPTSRWIMSRHSHCGLGSPECGHCHCLGIWLHRTAARREAAHARTECQVTPHVTATVENFCIFGLSEIAAHTNTPKTQRFR